MFACVIPMNVKNVFCFFLLYCLINFIEIQIQLHTTFRVELSLICDVFSAVEQYSQWQRVLALFQHSH